MGQPLFRGLVCRRAAVLGASFYDALGIATEGRERLPQTPAGFPPLPYRLDCRDGRRVEWRIQPLRDEPAGTQSFLAVGRDITAESQQQKKLEALHQAGKELAALTPEQLSEMCVGERVESLKLDIRRLTHDFLHYNVIEIRLLDPKTGKLEPLLEEGMTAGASGRSLFANLTGNGITGYVAASGKSYLCPDTAADPLYVPGAEGTRSSMTAPLLFQDEIIGTLNVESPQTNAFSEDDVKFIEMFGREIAAALHTLQLLSAEKRTSASQSIEAVNREVAMPVDEILGTAATVLDRYIGHDPDLVEKLKRILERRADHQAVDPKNRRRLDRESDGRQAGRIGRPRPQGHARARGRQRRTRPALGSQHIWAGSAASWKRCAMAKKP